MIDLRTLRRVRVWAATSSAFLVALVGQDRSASADVTCHPVAPSLVSAAAAIGGTTLLVPAVVKLADGDGELSYLTILGWTAAGSTTGATMGVVTTAAVVHECNELEAVPIVAPALGALSMGLLAAAVAAAFTGDEQSAPQAGRVAPNLPAIWAVPTASTGERPDGAMAGLSVSF